MVDGGKINPLDCFSSTFFYLFKTYIMMSLVNLLCERHKNQASDILYSACKCHVMNRVSALSTRTCDGGCYTYNSNVFRDLFLEERGRGRGGGGGGRYSVGAQRRLFVPGSMAPAVILSTFYSTYVWMHVSAYCMYVEQPPWRRATNIVYLLYKQAWSWVS